MSEIEVMGTGEVKGKKNGVGIKKRGRRPKDQKVEYELNKKQTKFFVDLSDDTEDLELIFNLLFKANKKDYGRELTFKDIALLAISKLGDKDIERLQDNSLTDMEKVERSRDDYNKKNNSNLSLSEFLVKRLGIN